MSQYLTPAELVDLTDKQTAPAQARRLRALKIPHFYAPGGRVKVLRAAVTEKQPAATQAVNEPDFSVFQRG